MSPMAYFAKQTILETERLCLRPLQLNDLEDYHEYVSDDELLRYDFPASRNLEESLEALVAYNLAQPLGRYALEVKENQKMIGHFSLRLNPEQTCVEIGYVIHCQYNGKGYGSEALRALISFLQTIPQLEKIIATIERPNIASQRLVEKQGFIHVETLKNVQSLRNEKTMKYVYVFMLHKLT
ncbi:GNAT family N-acetyltransferase [Candidatus Enterococcus willemsii]|uniref:N-acetyltransferase domain-containing protein n=1 Tax=Candidatus Enterococcus willemsii TaxID=1857215 RepID=A0ABQ6Z2Q4_9ENTE|nr:GNAT family N-acetyltransferase [Enterococcus sp. CU12B]KAF1305701.1 hypothetical protein BAU17_00175 [Enterococcus sp. CU12B]